MRKEWMTIVSRRVIAKETVRMELESETASLEALPGQFLHIQTNTEGNRTLRRPISIADIDEERKVITIVFKVIGAGTEELGRRLEGDRLDVLAPCGTGYPVQGLPVKKALLIGGGIGVPPLYYLGRQLKERGVEIISVLGFQSKEYVFYEEEFSQLGETFLVTDDGSRGSRGFVTGPVSRLEKDFDYFFTCGPTGMLKAVTTELAGQEGFVSVEQRMGCGIGACYACVIPSGETGFKKICKDGPVFKAGAVVL